MKMLRTVCFTFLLLSLGCSSTTVHLHANHMSESKQKELSQSLKRQGFSVRMRENEAPVSGNIIIYYPQHGIEEDLHKIQLALAANGLTAEQSYMAKVGKHEYTKENIGLYIANAGNSSVIPLKVRAEFPVTLTDVEFISVGCGQGYLYEFFENKKLSLTDMGAYQAEEESATQSYNWTYAGNDVVVISSDKGQFSYTIAESHAEGTRYGNPAVTYTIELEPMGYYPMPFGCNYLSDFFETF